MDRRKAAGVQQPPMSCTSTRACSVVSTVLAGGCCSYNVHYNEPPYDEVQVYHLLLLSTHANLSSEKEVIRAIRPIPVGILARDVSDRPREEVARVPKVGTDMDGH